MLTAGQFLKLNTFNMPIFDMSLFAEEMLTLFDKYGIRGVSGVFITAENNSLVASIRQPGEPALPYEIVADVLSRIIKSTPGAVLFESGEGLIKRKSE